MCQNSSYLGNSSTNVRWRKHLSNVSSWSPPMTSQESQCDTLDSFWFIRVHKFLRTKFHLRVIEAVKKLQANLDNESCLLKGAFVAIHSSCLGRSYLIWGSFLSKILEPKVKEGQGTTEHSCLQSGVGLDSVFFWPLHGFLFSTELFCRLEERFFSRPKYSFCCPLSGMVCVPLTHHFKSSMGISDLLFI